MRKKLILAAVLAVSAVFCSFTALADDITVEVNGTKITCDVPFRRRLTATLNGTMRQRA